MFKQSLFSLLFLLFALFFAGCEQYPLYVKFAEKPSYLNLKTPIVSHRATPIGEVKGEPILLSDGSYVMKIGIFNEFYLPRATRFLLMQNQAQEGLLVALPQGSSYQSLESGDSVVAEIVALPAPH